MKLTYLFFAAVALSFAFSGCSKDDDDEDKNPNNPPGGGKVQITGLSHEYVFWGKELTITGTGFSDVKEENIVSFVQSYPRTPGLKLTSDNGDIQIVDASPTNITIRVPFLTEEVAGRTHYSGEDFARVEVVVKEEKDTSDMVKFIGLPRVGNFDYHYGWFDLGGVTRSGDSVVLSGGFYGSLSGAGELHPKQAGEYDKLRLTVDGIPVPMKSRRISNSVKGFGIYLPAKDFSVITCEDGVNGWGDRGMNFELSVQDTDIKSSRTLFVTYLPEYSVSGAEGPTQVSKSLGGNPYWTVTGDDMYFSHALFVPDCGGATNASMEIANAGTINTEYQISIPLSLMIENCIYKFYLKTPCDDTELVGSVKIVP